ncbi:unnamed protein product [Parascedosporium putredinis]|uniref:Nucleolar protein 12 n=1 Tax=Parascedosporium putredinis TaxID=1442378 RepID=A0A9P1H7A7_9PEZI|nr:unnamed protein product [Parascedosporium putredinis]CAI7998474.1 unnamed protein product [Parascedosporium putredinis]
MAKGTRSVFKPSAAKIDPALDALFSSSTGPAPPIAANTRKPKRTQPTPESNNDDEDTSSGNGATDEDAGDEEVESELDASADESEDNEGEVKDADEVMQDAAPLGVDAVPTHSEKKRKRKDITDDLEDRHMRKLMRDNKDKEPSSKRQRGVDGESKESGVKGLAGSAEEDSDDDARPVHESLAKDAQPADIEKANRTVFLANVSTEAVSSKEAVKTLRAHLSSILDETASPKERIESIRFRSLAFSSLALPKRAAYITGSLMDATTKSCNAYVVYSTPTAARKAISGLNGTKVLERHLRVDSVAHPGKVDHRRCVFVGNLGFVDDETVLNTDKEGKTSSKKRYKIPSDIEEGFGAFSGRRPARLKTSTTPTTSRQLSCSTAKVSPMLPRNLRVTRAKNPQKTALAMQKRVVAPARATSAPGSAKYKPKVTPEAQSMAGRASKLLGLAGAARQALGAKKGFTPRAGPNVGDDIKTPEQIVFEGRRASAGDGLKLGKRPKFRKSGPKKLQGKRSQRSATWKKKKTSGGSD